MEVVIPRIDAQGVFPDFVLSPANVQELKKLQQIFKEMPGGIARALGCALCAAKDLGTDGLVAETEVVSADKLDEPTKLRVAMRCPRAPLYTQSPCYGAQVALQHLPCSQETKVDLYVG